MTDESIPFEAWVVLDLIFKNLAANTLAPEEIPAPMARTECSDLLDDLERQLYVDPLEHGSTADEDTPQTLRTQLVAFKFSRFVARDDRQYLAQSYARVLREDVTHNQPAIWRAQTIVDVLDGDTEQPAETTH